jgi:uncharacterized OB-fold protein
MTERTRFEPTESEMGAPVWAASRDASLVLPWCTVCGRPHWYPREVCPHCQSTDIEFRAAEGGATVYAVSVQHMPVWPGLADRAPYVVALVDLDEGVRMMTNLVGASPTSFSVGQRVQLTWEELSDGRQLPQFEPSA